MKTSNFISKTSGKAVPNQFILKGRGVTYFQSYDTIIAKIGRDGTVTLNSVWDHSSTTTKYLNQFLGTDNKKQILKNIADGLYRKAKLNK